MADDITTAADTSPDVTPMDATVDTDTAADTDTVADTDTAAADGDVPAVTDAVKPADVEMKTEKTSKEAVNGSTASKTDVVSKEESSVEKEEKKVDVLMEIEFEEGEDVEDAEIAEGHVGLDKDSCDLHFITTNNGLSGHTLLKNGFCYMWAGARANAGAKGGKIGYEVKVTGLQDVKLHENETLIHAARIGWSSENSDLQLGESSLSYGYESTGKVCASSSFFDYGESFTEGDVIGTYLDLESEPKTLKYTKNGKDLGVAMSLTVNLDEKALYPHIFLRNLKVEVNFGGNDNPWFEPLEGYNLIQNAGKENITHKSLPEEQEKNEVILMVGLPNSGKSTWVKKYVDSHSKKRYNVISVSNVLQRCKLEGKSRKKSDSAHGELMKNVMKILSKLYHLCPKKKRNFIYDQNNVYSVSQNTKMTLFENFKRTAVVVVPTHDNLRRRTSDAKRKGDNIHDVPFGDLCDMKCEFTLPTVGELFDEVIFPELDERNATKTICDYQSDGARAKRTGKDDYYPKKRPRYEERSYGRHGRSYSGGHDRHDDWKRSGSGYGGYGGGSGYGGRSNYGSGGGYKSRGSSNQYNDRRSGGGDGGYRQQSYGGGSGGGGYKGSNYGSSGGYSSGSYGSSYSSSNNSYGGSYGSSGASSGYGNYNQSSNNRGGSGGWGQQYGANNYGNQQSSQNQQWGSSTGGGWSGYNYNNYSGSGSGGGYSY